ncbi:hypothetical protein F66182_6804 [Fusarium sp. NRRL 66182]|nr:hypothetical protein F66182_6804 [Fusarium sp. NRRL 66182]
MPQTPKNRLWNPAFGIRFSPKAEHQRCYPFLDISRFVHTPGSNSNAAQQSEVDIEEFSEDEEFERDAAEWFDQQELLVSQPPEAVSEGTRVALDKDGNLVDASVHETEPIKDPVPPLTTLDYTIDPGLWEAARKSQEGSPESFWSYTMYRQIQDNGEQQNVKVHYCRSKKTMEHTCEKYFRNEKVIGFDLEWWIGARGSTDPRKAVSLIQIASPSHIALFHIALFPKDDFVAPTFKKMMEDESVAKVGVAIKGDCTRLRKSLGIETKGILELSHLYKLVKYSKSGELNRINKVQVSLALQTQELLGLPLFKGGDVRSSNWSIPLIDRQVSYAASDAYAGLQLYYVLEQERKKLDPTPPRPEFAEKNLPIKYLTVDDQVDESDEASDSDEPEVIVELDVGLDEPETKLAQPAEATSEKTTQDTTDVRIIAAEARAQQYYHKMHRYRKVPRSSLRTYFIWYDNEDLTPDAIAKLLRNPPLKTNTVVSYILDTIINEKVPYSKTRLRNEVLAHLAPAALSAKKFRALVEESQESEEEL